MAEEDDKKEEGKFELDSAGQALAYISLDQARVLAMEHARDNTGFYGRRYRRRHAGLEGRKGRRHRWRQRRRRTRFPNR